MCAKHTLATSFASLARVGTTISTAWVIVLLVVVLWLWLFLLERVGIVRAAGSMCSLPLKGGGLGRGSTSEGDPHPPAFAPLRGATAADLPLSGGGDVRHEQ